MPLEQTGKRLPALLDDSELVVKGGHTRSPGRMTDRVTGAILQFLDARTPSLAR